MSQRVMFLLFAGPEMPCKLQHAFLFARDLSRNGGETTIVFEGNSPRWLLELTDPGHRLPTAFTAVKEEGLVGGVCRGCAGVHGALDAAEALGFPLLGDAFGHVSLVPFIERGHEIITL